MICFNKIDIPLHQWNTSQAHRFDTTLDSCNPGSGLLAVSPRA